MRYIQLAKEKYSVKFLRSITEEQAIRMLPHLDKNQVINAWKQANGVSKRNTKKLDPKVEVIEKK